MRYIKFLTIFSLVTGCAICSSCNLFTPREPESPTLAQSSYQLPTTADVLLVNLQSAFAELNADNYVRSFSPTQAADGQTTVSDYTFTPAVETASLAGSLFQGWSIAAEDRFFRNYRSRIKEGFGAAFLYTEKQRIVQAQEIQLEISYIVQATYTSADLQSPATGRAQLILTQTSTGTWYISRWLDYKEESAFTISELKRLLSN